MILEALSFSSSADSFKPTGNVIDIRRHARKEGADGPLSRKGLVEAKREGKKLASTIGKSPTIVTFETGSKSRTVQTAQVLESEVAKNSLVALGQFKERSDLSSDVIFIDPKKSALVRSIRRCREEIDTCPWYMFPWFLNEQRNNTAIGQVLLKWLSYNDKNPDAYTSSPRQVARLMAQNILDSIENFKKGEDDKRHRILQVTHEMQVLVITKYFLFRNLRRGIESGDEIIEKIGGKIHTLGGVRIYDMQNQNGEKIYQARFNNKWYSLDMARIYDLAQELDEDKVLSPFISKREVA